VSRTGDTQEGITCNICSYVQCKQVFMKNLYIALCSAVDDAVSHLASSGFMIINTRLEILRESNKDSI
jgi:hypothetical protein